MCCCRLLSEVYLEAENLQDTNSSLTHVTLKKKYKWRILISFGLSHSLLEYYPTLKYWNQLLWGIILTVPQSSVHILVLEAWGIKGKWPESERMDCWELHARIHLFSQDWRNSRWYFNEVQDSRLKPLEVPWCISSGEVFHVICWWTLLLCLH